MCIRDRRQFLHGRDIITNPFRRTLHPREYGIGVQNMIQSRPTKEASELVSCTLEIVLDFVLEIVIPVNGRVFEKQREGGRFIVIIHLFVISITLKMQQPSLSIRNDTVELLRSE